MHHQLIHGHAVFLESNVGLKLMQWQAIGENRPLAQSSKFEL